MEDFLYPEEVKMHDIERKMKKLIKDIEDIGLNPMDFKQKFYQRNNCVMCRKDRRGLTECIFLNKLKNRDNTN